MKPSLVVLTATAATTTPDGAGAEPMILLVLQAAFDEPLLTGLLLSSLGAWLLVLRTIRRGSR